MEQHARRQFRISAALLTDDDLQVLYEQFVARRGDQAPLRYSGSLFPIDTSQMCKKYVVDSLEYYREVEVPEVDFG